VYSYIISARSYEGPQGPDQFESPGHDAVKYITRQGEGVLREVGASGHYYEL